MHTIHSMALRHTVYNCVQELTQVALLHVLCFMVAIVASFTHAVSTAAIGARNVASILFIPTSWYISIYVEHAKFSNKLLCNTVVMYSYVMLYYLYIISCI